MTPDFIAPDLMPAFPAVFLCLMTMVLLLFGVAKPQEEDCKTITNFAIFTLIGVGLVLTRFVHDKVVSFGGAFIVDDFSTYMNMVVVFGAAVTLLMSGKYLERERLSRFEYPVLVLFSTLGMMVMISANDLMTLYVGIELQSLPLYVLAAMQRDTVRSTEAGLKYFVLGALASGLLLYGASLLYGYTGTTNFDMLAAALTGEGQAPLGVIFGMVMLIAGMAFKISAVPFHMWAPDVYEGAPTSVTAFFAIVPKMAALALMTRVFMGPLGNMVDEWRQIVIVLSVASMALGSIAAIAQTNIKRLLAYSSIGHMGYALVGLAAASGEGVKAVLVYIVIYMISNIGVFAIVLMMKRQNQMVESISDLSGLSRRQPMLALAMTIMMFSMAGIPPLAGFFGKLFIFQAAIDAQLYKLAIAGVVTSVIGAFYYLRIIKVMYFDEPIHEAFDKAEDNSLTATLTLASLFVVFFIIVPVPLLTSATVAAQSILH